MKNLYLSLTFLLLSITLSAQPWQWSIRGGAVNAMQVPQEYNNVTHLETDQNGNVYILCKVGAAGLKIDNQPLVAYSDIGTGNTLDILLASYTASGQFRWAKVIGGSSNDHGQSLSVDNHGNVLVSGLAYSSTPNYTAVHFSTDTVLPQTYRNDTLKKNMFMVQYDSSGTFQWLRMPEPDTVSIPPLGPRENNSYPFRHTIDQSGSAHWLAYLRPGQFAWSGNNIISQEGDHIIKYNTAGQVTGHIKLNMNTNFFTQWAPLHILFAYNPILKQYYIGGTLNVQAQAPIVIGGDTISDPIYLAAFDSTGQVLWKIEGQSVPVNNCSINALSVDKDGSIFLAGTTSKGSSFAGHTFDSPVPALATPFIVKLDGAGNLLWANSAVPNAGSYGNALAINDSDVALTGYAGRLYWPGNTDTMRAVFNQGYDAFLARFDKTTGELITMDRAVTNFGGASYGNALAAGPAHTYYLGGNFSDQLYLGPDTMYKVGSQRSFFVSKYQCAVPEASYSFSATNSSHTLHLYYTGSPADSVAWLLDDGTRLLGDTVSHSYAAKGRYQVCVRAYFPCTKVTVCDSLDAGSIGLEEKLFSTLAIYPNPTSGTLHLNGLPKGSSFQLLNVSGHLVLAANFNQENETLDVAHLPKGMYLLQIQTTSGERWFSKIVKR